MQIFKTGRKQELLLKAAKYTNFSGSHTIYLSSDTTITTVISCINSFSSWLHIIYFGISIHLGNSYCTFVSAGISLNNHNIKKIVIQFDFLIVVNRAKYLRRKLIVISVVYCP